MPRSGFGGAVTVTPLARSWGITPLQLEPSANAPCTRTTVAASEEEVPSVIAAPFRSRLGGTSPQRPERRPHLLGEQRRLLPGGEVPALGHVVEMDQVVRIGALRPASRCLVQLVREHADGVRDGDRLGVEERSLVLPVVP